MTILDARQVADLLALDKGQGVLLSGFVNAFASSAVDRIAQITAYAVAGECTALADQAHALRGSAGNLGAVKLAGLLEQVEAAGKRQDIDGVRKLVSGLDAEYSATRDALRAVCERTP